MSVRRLAPLLVFHLVLSACDDGAAPPPSPPLFEATLELRIGSVNDPGSLLTYITGMAVGPEGRIYSAHPRESLIRIHGPDGWLAATIGGPGEGPGEFRSLRAIGLVGETLWAFDAGLSRVSYFTAAGDLIRTLDIPIHFRGSPAEKSPPRPMGVLQDGRVLGTEMAWSRELAAETLTEIAVVAMDTVGTVLDTLYIREPTVWAIRDLNDPSGFGAYRPQPFDDAPLFAHSPTGPAYVTVDRTVPDGAATTFRVARVKFAGDTVWIRQFAYDPVAIDPALPDSLVEAFAEGVSGSEFGNTPALRKALDLARGDLEVPAHYPPVDRVYVGLDETVWLRMGGPEEATVEWLVLDADGEPVARVRLPGGLHLQAARMDRVWGWVTDDLDVPYIVRYGLVPAHGSAD